MEVKDRVGHEMDTLKREIKALRNAQGAAVEAKSRRREGRRFQDETRRILDDQGEIKEIVGAKFLAVRKTPRRMDAGRGITKPTAVARLLTVFVVWSFACGCRDAQKYDILHRQCSLACG